MASSGPPCPYDNASIISAITFGWVDKLWLTAIKRPLTDNDLYAPPTQAGAKLLADQFQRRWLSLTEERRKEKGSLIRLLLLIFWKRVALACVLALLMDGLKVVQLFIVIMLTRYLSGSSTISTQLAYVLVAAMTITSFAIAICLNQSFFKQYALGMHLKTTCAAMIFKKVMTLSSSQRDRISTGHIVNLLATDVEAFHLAMMSLYSLVVSPLLLLAFGISEGFQTGIAILAGLALILLFVILRYFSGKFQGRIRLIVSGWTDRRVHLMSEIIAAMRVVKMYCWEKHFAAKVQTLRRKETSKHMRNVLLLSLGLASGMMLGKICVFVILMVSVAMGNDISPEVSVRLIGWLKVLELTVFIALGLGFSTLSEMIAATGRIQDFLNAEDMDENLEHASSDDGAEPEVVLTNTSAIWEANGEPPDDGPENPTFTLHNVTCGISNGQLAVVVGPVGSGKSSLLMAILGELPLLEGVRRLSGSVAYVPQESWIMSDTIRANILLGSAMDTDKYDDVINACALNVDLSKLPDGDLTLVGERGLSLSGGQKARVNLARAVYRDADIYLLDDPLSALDSRVGNIVFDKCICGLLKTRLRILVTHQLQFLRHADVVLGLNEGKTSAVGQAVPAELDVYVDKRRTNDLLGSETNMEGLPLSEMYDEEHKAWKTNTHDGEVERIGEVREVGAVSRQVYLQYMKAGHGAIVGPIVLVLICIKMASDVGSDWWLSKWTHSSNTSWVVNGSHPGDSLPYIPTLSGLVAVYVVSMYAQSILLAYLIVTASRRLYVAMFDRVLRAPMAFFERNPVGQILNRFSRDTGFMDHLIPYSLFQGQQYATAILAYFVYGCVIVPWMAIGAVLLVAAVCTIAYLSLQALRDFRRIEAGTRSPLYSHLSNLLQGVTVVRAHRLQTRFLQTANQHIDRNTSAWFLYISLQRHMAFRIECLVAIFFAIYMIVVVSTQRNRDQAGTTGLSLVYLFYIAAPLQYSIQRVAEIEMAMTSVERILQYCHLDQEAPEYTDVRPPSQWPKDGNITLDEVSLTYRQREQPALGPLSLMIKSAQKIGVVGRTGAGKTSLFTSLLRMVEPTGSIIIDGIDVTKLGLTDLRRNISVIPQDPMLFSGRLRESLDPFEEYEDLELWTALSQVQLVKKVKSLSSGLLTDVGEAGSHFSVGQRQLLCMARALLRNNKIIIIDEATANVDYDTDSIIQNTLETQFSECTVLAIAHRLVTIIKYDKILVLDHGGITQFGYPFELLQDSEGSFHKMAQQLGPAHYQYLTAAARRQHLKAIQVSSRDTSGLGLESRRDDPPSSTAPATRTIEGAVNEAFEEDSSAISFRK